MSLLVWFPSFQGGRRGEGEASVAAKLVANIPAPRLQPTCELRERGKSMTGGAFPIALRSVGSDELRRKFDSRRCEETPKSSSLSLSYHYDHCCSRPATDWTSQFLPPSSYPYPSSPQLDSPFGHRTATCRRGSASPGCALAAPERRELTDSTLPEDLKVHRLLLIQLLLEGLT